MTPFRQFYESLYSSEYPPSLDNQTNFLDELEFTKVSENDSSILDSALTATEICEAVDAMNSGKAAGPDGLPIDIYKKFIFSDLYTI